MDERESGRIRDSEWGKRKRDERRKRKTEKER